MWRIFKAELRYNISGLMIGFIIVSLFFLATFIWDNMNLYTFIINSSISCFIMIGIVGSETDKEKRDRLYTLLPNTIREVAWFRLLFMFIFQAFVLALWLVVYFVELPEVGGRAIWTVFSANGFLISFIMLFAIYHDLNYFSTNKYKYLFFVWVLLGLLLIYIQRPDLVFVRMVDVGHSFHVFELYKDLFTSALGAVIANLVCFGLIYLDVTVYCRRRLYLA